MSLRTRLAISFTVLLLIVIGSVGVVASRSVNEILIAQLDRDLATFSERGPVPGDGHAEEPQRGDFEGEEDGEFLRPIAEVVVDAQGEIVLARQSGYRDDPDPLPDVSELPETTEPVRLPSVDGSLDYRAVATRLPDGATLVRAAPLTDAASATSALIRTLVLGGSGVLLLGGAATWWSVERSMRPVEQMVDTAEAIASGDLSRRVPQLDSGTELGRLGTSLNEMLAHIEHAVDVERDTNDRLRQFVADASHELRTPIAAISGYAELRRKGGLEGAEDKAWSRIESEGNRMGSLVEDLLMLARLGQGRPLRVGRFDMPGVVRNAIQDHTVIDPARPVTLRAPDTLDMEGDEERFHQVITSLLSNVRVHTPPGTTVEVAVRDLGHRVEVAVTDDGPGIPIEALQQVFDRFFRADPSRSRRSGGSGLGLAIVEAIVTAHGGTVAASNVPGAGARISMTLPKHQTV
jgi:two-component system OmpR family sensor kinase